MKKSSQNPVVDATAIPGAGRGGDERDRREHAGGSAGVDRDRAGRAAVSVGVEGSTESATLITELLVDLRDRGLDVTGPILVGIHGAKALRHPAIYGDFVGSVHEGDSFDRRIGKPRIFPACYRGVRVDVFLRARHLWSCSHVSFVHSARRGGVVIVAT